MGGCCSKKRDEDWDKDWESYEEALELEKERASQNPDKKYVIVCKLF